MAELTRSAPADVSRIAVLGASLKMEVVKLEPASGASVAQDDTFYSRLQNPQFGFLFVDEDNSAAISLSLTTGSDSTDPKLVVVNVTSGSVDADAPVVAVVFGQ